MGDLCGTEHALHRNLELEDEIVRTADNIRHAVHVFRSKVGIGSGSHCNAVLRIAVHQNQGSSRCLVGAQYAGAVYAFFLISRYCIVTEDVPSHLANERHICAETLCGYCLICSLSPGAHTKFSPKHGLTRLGKSVAFYCHIGIAASDNDYFSFMHYQ